MKPDQKQFPVCTASIEMVEVWLLAKGDADDTVTMKKTNADGMEEQHNTITGWEWESG